MFLVFSYFINFFQISVCNIFFFYLQIALSVFFSHDQNYRNGYKNYIYIYIYIYIRKNFKITHIFCDNIYSSWPFIFSDLTLNKKSAEINIITKNMSDFKVFSYLYIYIYIYI